jgi:hypothetical protein
MAFNLFEAPDYYGGLLGEEATNKLQNRALTTGLINAALGYIAQPKNQRYGSALPYLGKALAGGYQAGQETINSGLQDYMKQQQVAEMKRQQQQRAARQDIAQNLYTTIPAQFRDVQQPAINVPVPSQEGAVAPSFATQYQPSQMTREIVTPERRVINTEALTRLASVSDDPLAALSTTAKLIPELRRAGMVQGSENVANPFDVYVTGAASPNAKKLAAKYAQDYKSGIIDDEKANTLLNNIANMEDKFAAREENAGFRQQMLEQNAGMKQQALQLAQSSQALQKLSIEDRLYDRKLSREKDVEAKQKRLGIAEEKAATVMNTIDSALDKTGFFTTGLTGAISAIPGSKSYTLRKDIDTIKANIGFDELQAMRESSPTGGALGQVAVQELNSLQSTLGSLDPNQDEATLRTNLNNIYKHYSNWKDAVQKAQESAPAPQGKQIKRTGTEKGTGRKVIEYSDGSVEYGN